jgi:AbrB family looped-hinge helix DNA binding protein
MSSKGQIVIPASIRARHGLRPGDELLLEERNDEVVLKELRSPRKKSLVQWMQECPMAYFRIERLKDVPKRSTLGRK